MLSEERRLTKIPEEFKRYFWDVSFDKLSLKKNRQFVTERILNYGGLKEIKWLLSCTDKPFIKSVIKKSHNLNSKTKNYWEVVLASSKSKFR